MNRMNMWQRLGVVASILWIVGSLFWENHVYQERYDAAISASVREHENFCHEKYGLDGLRCYIQGVNFPEIRKPSRIRPEFWFNAFAPIFAGWLSAYPIIWTARCVLAGQKAGQKSTPRVLVFDYESILERAISKLESNNPHAREEIYARARSALSSTEFVDDNQRKTNMSKLEQAIRLVEKRSPRPIPAKGSTTLLFVTILFPGLWVMDFTSMSIYWVAPPRNL
jgi:hypothetical protein